ncbi:hypothetical protein BJX61DRAFT_542569 [Aspergillus egyptiacus]|nr:hypothetical protein BJX61DRAFT_542569 [Aspergillus egyptiacus]
MKLSVSIAGAMLCMGLANAHTVIVYPGYRGNNLHTNGSVDDLHGLGVAYDSNNDSLAYPFGMQWIYPCGGMPTSTNRTKWPVQGGAISIQPGWFPGHSRAMIHFNLGLGTEPPNMSHPMVTPFGIVGPDNDPYPGTICLPQVPLPAGVEVNVGDNATIQVIELAQHGAALYNCADITFAEPEDVPEVTDTNCFNSSHISFEAIFTTSSLENAGLEIITMPTLITTPQLSTTSTQSAQSAATHAFLNSQPSSNSLSSAAAAAALRSLTPTPTPVENVQTKRMLQRQASVSSQPAGPLSLRPSSRNGLRRVNSSGSMTTRTFREQSPRRPTSSYSTMSSPPVAPPLPSIPPEYAARKNRNRRAVSLGPQVWPSNPDIQATETGTSLKSQAVEPDSARSPASPGPSKVLPGHQRSESRNSINFSYPMNSRTNSPTYHREEATSVLQIDHSTPANTSHKRHVSQTSNNSRQQTYGTAPAAPDKGPRATGTALLAAQAASVTRNEEPITSPVPSRKVHHREQVAHELSPSRSPASVNTTRPRTQAKKPATTMETPEATDRSEPGPIKQQKDHRTIKPVLSEAPRAQSPRALTPPVSEKAQNFSRTPPVSPPGSSQGAESDGELQLSPLHQPSISGRSARFSTQPIAMNLAEQIHEPPPRSVSPSKSALKVARNSSLSPDGRLHGILRPGPPLSEISDATSITSDDGARPNQRRKFVKVSFDDEAEVVGPSASPPTSPEEVVPESPPGKSKPKTTWFGLHKRKSSPLRTDVDEFDGVLKPRAALPSFGSIRGSKDRARPDVASQTLYDNESTLSDSDGNDVNMSFSNDHAIGNVLSHTSPEAAESGNPGPAVGTGTTTRMNTNSQEDGIPLGDSQAEPSYFQKTPLSPLPEAPSEQSLPLTPNANLAQSGIMPQPATPDTDKERQSFDEYDDAAEFPQPSVEMELDEANRKSGKKECMGSTDDDSSSIYSDAEEDHDGGFGSINAILDRGAESENPADVVPGVAITSSEYKADDDTKEADMADFPTTCVVDRPETPVQDDIETTATDSPRPIEPVRASLTNPSLPRQATYKPSSVQGGITRSSSVPVEVHTIAHVRDGDHPEEVLSRYDQAISNATSKRQTTDHDALPNQRTVKKAAPVEQDMNGASAYIPRRPLSNGSDSSSSFKRTRRASRGGMSMRRTLRGSQPSNSVTSSPTRSTVPRDPQPSLPSGLGPGTMRTTLRGNVPRKEKSSFFSTSKLQKGRAVRSSSASFTSRFPESDSDSDDDSQIRRRQRGMRIMTGNDMRPVRGIPRRQGAPDGDSTELEDSSDGERRPTSGPKTSARQSQPAPVRDPALAAVARSRGMTEEELEALLSRGSTRKSNFIDRLSLKKSKPPAQRGNPTNGTSKEDLPVQAHARATDGSDMAAAPTSPSRLLKRSLHKKSASDAWPLGSENAEPLDFGIGSTSARHATQGLPRPQTSDGVALNGNKTGSPRHAAGDSNDAQPFPDEPYAGGHRASEVVIEGSGRKKRFQRLRNALKIH